MEEMMKASKILDIAKKIENRTRKSGYENTFDFHKRSGIGIAYYTIVRFFDPEHEKAPSITTIIEIAHYAGMSNSEICEILKSLGDKFWWKLIAPSKEEDQLTPKEIALISGVRKVVKIDQEMWDQYKSALKLTSAAVGIDCKKELSVLG